MYWQLIWNMNQIVLNCIGNIDHSMIKHATVWPCCILVQKTRKYLMRKICRLHVLIRIQPDQYQARPIRGQDLGGAPAPGIIGVTRPGFFAEARRVFCLCCTSPFVGYSPRFPLSPTIILRIFSRWVIGPHYDVSDQTPNFNFLELYIMCYV